jgi:transposase InsO family protein
LANKTEIDSLIAETHNSLIGGHMGIKKTLMKLKELYHWKNMKNDIKKYIRACKECQKNKITRRIKMPMVITSTSKKPGERWAMDIVGPLDLSVEGYRYLLTCQDDLTRYLVAIPLKDQESDTIARAFTKHIVLRFGCPEAILTDNATNFTSNLMKRVFKLLQIKKKINHYISPSK